LNTLRGFLRCMLGFGPGWLLWLSALLAVNLLFPLFFLESIEARTVLLAFATAAGIQIGLYARLGFVRLLGIAHLVAWTPVLVWILFRLPLHDTSTPIGRWLVVLLVIDGVSLLIDAVDVVRYAAGERAPTVEP